MQLDRLEHILLAISNVRVTVESVSMRLDNCCHPDPDGTRHVSSQPTNMGHFCSSWRKEERKHCNWPLSLLFCILLVIGWHNDHCCHFRIKSPTVVNCASSTCVNCLRHTRLLWPSSLTSTLNVPLYLGSIEEARKDSYRPCRITIELRYQ